MDRETRFVLATDLSPVRTARPAATALSTARERTETHPSEIKTDGPRSYRQALPPAFPTRRVKPTISNGIRAEINNVDGLVTHHNYFRPHESPAGKRPAASAGATLPFQYRADVAGMQSDGLPQFKMATRGKR